MREGERTLKMQWTPFLLTPLCSYGDNQDNSGHDRLSQEDIDEVVDLIDSTIVPGGHAVVFCSFLQFRGWYDSFA